MKVKNRIMLKTFGLITIISLIVVIHFQAIQNKHEIKHIERKIDSILIMQKRMYDVDSMYLKATRIHMGQCAFVLRKGITADVNN